MEEQSRYSWSPFLYGGVLLAVILSCLWYPVTRDELFYLDSIGAPNPFVEFIDSYYFTNPRIGQFFCNVVGRNIVLELIFGLLLFVCFFQVVYRFVFDRKLNYKSSEDIAYLLSIIAIFVFFIKQFGEMFYYVPFSTNYTLTHLFYLSYLYIIWMYFAKGKTIYFRNSFVGMLVLISMGVFVGMGNEHVPPILLLVTGIAALYYLKRNKKLPDLQIIVLGIGVFIGYLLLFFAPAQSTRYAGKGNKESLFNLNHYFDGFIQIAKVYYYRNPEIIIALLLTLFVLIIGRRKFSKNSLNKIWLCLAVGFASFSIVAFSPLIETRLLFFSNSLFIISFLILVKSIFDRYSGPKFSFLIITHSFILLFFAMSVVICYHAHTNYTNVMEEIDRQRVKTKNVVLEESFNFEIKELSVHNRRILLDKGFDYINEDPSQDTPQETNLKRLFQLESISVKEKK